MPASSPRRISILGLLSLLVALAACAATRAPIAGYGPMPIGLLALGLGLLALLFAMLRNRASGRLPVMGIAIAAVAIGLTLFNQGKLSEFLPGSRPAANPQSSGGALPGSPAIRHSATEEAASKGPRSIFDMDGGDKSPGAPSPQVGRGPAPQPPAQHPVAQENSANLLTAVHAARAKLEAARKEVADSLASDPAFRAAKAEVDEADAERKQAVKDNGPGTAPAIAASQKWIEAKAKLQRILKTASENDPRVKVAQNELDRAEAQVKGAARTTR